MVLESNAAATPPAPTATTPASSASAPLSERENPGIQGTESRLTDINMTGTTRAAENPVLTSNGSPAPPARASNTEATGETQPPVKRTKGSAVVGTGLTEKYVTYYFLTIQIHIRPGTFA